VVDRARQVRKARHTTLAPPALVGQVQVEQHHDTGLRVETGKRDQTHPDGDRLAAWSTGDGGVARYGDGLAADFETYGLWIYDGSWTWLADLAQLPP
jgi:hypothetical protein